MKKICIYLIVVMFLFAACQKDQNVVFQIDGSKTTLQIYLEPEADSLIYWAVSELAEDIGSICGQKPEISIEHSDFEHPGIYVGECGSHVFNNVSMEVQEGQWEGYHIKEADGNLYICGSDPRGVAYGIFEFTERMGISPWSWWADVVPEQKKRIRVALPSEGLIGQPSVQYRGIFLNDEDWGLQPWAAKTFEPEVGDIGPRTYEKIFQLLLRLKANTIWPAMHPSTRAFYTIEGNKEMAAKYHIVVGTSHAEPMLRNNVDEWNREEQGQFNYFVNREKVDTYWRERIVEVSDPAYQFMATVGMRGEHDSKMQGGSSDLERVQMMEQIIANQREILEEELHTPANRIPQVLIPYKEVLDLYNKGMKIEDDITLMWTDDNYGYIRHFSTMDEQERTGGSGVYYHLSYWGRPHDYLWLSTTQPGLIWYEMTRAWQNGARKIWIANVGDIKPAEYNMEFFLDLAWNIDCVDEYGLFAHKKQWAEREFGRKHATQIAGLMDEYYRLAFLRKPEYMGWSQTEPTTETRPTEYSFSLHGNELEKRINEYQSLVKSCERIKKALPEDKWPAYFQLVEYPVKGAAKMNEKFLYYQEAQFASDENLKAEYLSLSEEAFSEIQDLTKAYNTEISEGKWNYILHASPRNLPVFRMPDYRMEYVGTDENVSRNVPPPVFFNARQYRTSLGTAGYNWISIDGLGYSNAAVTLDPFTASRFADLWPGLTYDFVLKDTGKYVVELRCLPTHTNTFDQALRISVDGAKTKEYNISTRGRSKQWKNNVLMNAAVVMHEVNINKAGKHSLSVWVNQTGIVLDQIAVYPSEYPHFYEIRK